MSSSSSQSDTIAGVNLPDLSARSLSYLMVGVLTDTLTSKPGRAADLTSLAAEAARRKAGFIQVRTVTTASRYSPAGCISRFGQAGKVQRTKVVGASCRSLPMDKQSDWTDSSIRFGSLSVTDEHRGCDG
jgi:hypothetical protein